MRTLLLSTILLTATTATSAQCPFTATVTPNDPILCPFVDAELSTQEFDTYQWYRNGTPIPGADQRTLTVDAETEIPADFSVRVSLDGCYELSDTSTVDSWAFPYPYVIHGGDAPVSIGDNGEPFFCEGDTLTLEMGLPWTTNVSWYNNGVEIPGEHGVILTVTTNGAYTSSGAFAECPDFILFQGVPVRATFLPVVQPTIMQTGDDLCAEPEGSSYQWYLNNAPLPGNTACIPAAQEGSYTVYVTYPEQCPELSAPYLVTGIGEVPEQRFELSPNPTDAGARIAWPAHQAPKGTWMLLNTAGQVERRGVFASIGSVWLDTRTLASGQYVFRAADDVRWAPLPISVMH